MGQQSQQQQQQQTYLNVAIQSLKQAYPDAVLHKQTETSSDWRVAFELPISPGVPLFMKISLL